MGTDLFGDFALLVGLIVGVTTLGRMLRGVESRLRKEMKEEIASVREEGVNGRARLETQIGGLRTELGEVELRLDGRIDAVRAELRRVEKHLGDRIDAVRDELVETRVAMADRVARIEGRVFGVPLPGTGTDTA